MKSKIIQIAVAHDKGNCDLLYALSDDGKIFSLQLGNHNIKADEKWYELRLPQLPEKTDG